MKAVRIYAHGGPEMLRYEDVAEPVFGPDDLLVRVALTSVSGWDVKYRKGVLAALPGRRPFALPMQPGRDAVGTVAAVGANVTAFRPGDAVVGLVHPANPSSPLTIRGLGNLSTDIDLRSAVSPPDIHAILPMAQVADAHRLLESGAALGRLLLDSWRQTR